MGSRRRMSSFLGDTSMREIPRRALIDWSRLGRAVNFYKGFGFQQIETPWRITQAIYDATAPQTATPFRCRLDGDRPDILVGSAEQGLLEIMGSLRRGNYLSVSPCFRDNEVDETHFSDFMKVELCVVDPSPDAHEWLGLLATRFAKSEGTEIERVMTDSGFDLYCGGIEIGSYGLRSAALGGQIFTWAYGTGLAEPRFSQAIQYGSS